MFAVAYEEVNYVQPRQRVKRQTKRSTKVRLAVLSCITLVACVLAMFILNAKMVYNSYDIKIGQYQRQCEILNNKISELQSSISALKNYDSLEAKARKLGLVPILATYHLDLNSQPIIASGNNLFSKTQF
jgi:cell division protein FtsL